MSKVKRFLSIMVAMIMVLAMSVPAFAATKDTATITVNNADKATLAYAQVIVADRTTETGWNFVSDNVAQAYMKAFEVTSAQAAIKAMIPEGSVDGAKLAVAQANAENYVSMVSMANPQEVSAAGVYLVKATETGYTYNLMSAYVGFEEVAVKDEENGTEITYEYPSLKDVVLEAKKSETIVNKAVEDSDNVTTTGATLTYTVKTNVPFIAPTETDKTFWVYDELTGAVYTNTTTATITLGGVAQTAYTINFDEVNNKFSVDLSGMINDGNTNAGKEVVITYQVKVTAENDTITNKAYAGHEGKDNYGSTTINTYEGNITLTKTNEDGSVKLAGAGFEVRKDSQTSAALKFTKLSDGVYKYDPEATENVVTEVVTKADGTVTVKGLDVGTYYFKEITAPVGYSINATDSTATLKVEEGKAKAEAVLTATTSMTDTKLNALPSTGGIGTTIFTIGGCAIMIVAAGLFFATRRKTQK